MNVIDPHVASLLGMTDCGDSFKNKNRGIFVLAHLSKKTVRLKKNKRRKRWIYMEGIYTGYLERTK